ncbi:hypothetical protein [Streptomyces sp. NPDC052042]|uniref:hypothetical protein n=1 Tax=Streptomyces sp. NPDC052042 TaxID=3365683 RepID=UPI0037CFD6B7
MKLPQVWGVREDEVRAVYPCDGLLEAPREQWFRAVTVRADRATVFRWLCQLKVAPYSYDLLDNLGRRSPRVLTPGAEHLENGQRVMYIFRLAAFEPDRHLTVVLDQPRALRLFGGFALSYTLTEQAPGVTRLVAKLVVGDDDGVLGRLRRPLMSWGDLFMMHRQLHTLRKLAEGR